MALYPLHSSKQIHDTRHEQKFAQWCSRLTYEQTTAIRAELQKLLSSRSEFVSSELAGSTWKGTPFQAIHDHACQGDSKQAGLCIGVFIWEAAQIHPERWTIEKASWGLGKLYKRRS